MAGRKDKNTVDYFPHYCESGKTIFILESKFGNNGYAVWYKTLELLGKNESHYIDCRNVEEQEFVSAKMKLMYAEIKLIYDTLANINKINKELWEQGIVYCPNFIKNIEDVYKRRNNKLLHFEGLCEHLSIKCKQKYDIYGIIANGNTQSKVKESKVEESKEEEIQGDLPEEIKKPKKQKKEIALDFVSPEYLEIFSKWLRYKKDKGKQYKNYESTKAAYNKLVNLSDNNPKLADEIIEESLANNWEGFFKLKETGKETKSGRRNNIQEFKPVSGEF